MKRTPWFERKFPPIADNGLLPTLLERLEGTPVRLRAMVTGSAAGRGESAGWSAAKEIGHLGDLEPLWIQRVHDLRAGLPDLTAADLTNRATHETDHDSISLTRLIDRFESSRRTFIDALRLASDAELERTARHPRLGTPMRMVDLANFAAEHDDHHLARLRELLSR